MGATAAKAESLPDERFRHEALFYAGDEQFVEACVSFIRAGIEADEPTLVVALANKLEQLRAALGPDAERVHFADMDAVGRNPARIIPAWQEFVDEHAEPGVRLRGIRAPAFPGRGPPEPARGGRRADLPGARPARARRVRAARSVAEPRLRGRRPFLVDVPLRHRRPA